MFGKMFLAIRKKPFFVLLCLILTVISVGMIKPDFFLMGWDNYSSYFNLKTNLFRTFFATWREYRGLGVPSDAEVTDIFRLILQWILHFFVAENLLDQAYYVVCLWTGVLSMYFLGRILLQKYINRKSGFGDVFGGMASLFYLFNLNTLSVFYSPIIPFTNRFWSLPLTLFLLLKFEKEKTKKNLLWLLLVIFIGSGSYITPTVLITNLIAFVIFGLFVLDVRKTFLYSLLFIFINAFWLLPFVNYVVQKSAIVPLARTFVEINESMLNKSESFFSLKRQSILWPSFLDMKFGSINKQAYTIHPLLNDFLSGWGRGTLFLFPVIYAIGSLLIILDFKKNRRFLWVPAWIVIFLFLSTKEYGPLGFIYEILAKNIPFFKMIFRIGDTKFHSYIAIGASLAGAYFVYKLINLFKSRVKYLVWVVVGILLTWYTFQFRSYVGNMMGFFVYTKLPAEYSQMAKIINDDKGIGRVLHLPLAWGHQYWKSYSWGYLGSAWLNNLLDKPLVDKTFEPASMENSYLNSKINNILDSFATAEVGDKKDMAENFLKLLSSTGIGYVIVDHTVDSSIYSRNIYYNSKQYVSRAAEVMKYLAKDGLVEKVYEFEVNLDELYGDYEKLYPVSKIGLPDSKIASGKIELYKVLEIEPMFLGVNKVSLIENNLDNLSETNLIFGGETILQKETGTIVPFMRQNHKLTIGESEVSMEYEISEKSVDYIVKKKLAKSESSMMDVFAKFEDGKLGVTIYDRYLPDINGQEFRREVGSIEFLDVLDLSLYRLRVGDVFLKLPNKLYSDTYIESVMTHGQDIEVGLFKQENMDDLNLSEFGVNQPLPCFGPMLAGFEGGVDVQEENIKMVSRKGGACVNNVVSPSLKEKQYVEMDMKLKAISDGQQAMRAYVCLYEGETNNCLNGHRQLRLYNDWTEYRVEVENMISGLTDIKIEVGSIPGGADSQDMDIGQIVLKSFVKKEGQVISYKKFFGLEKVSLESEVKIDIPKAKSNYSYFHNIDSDMFSVPQEMCANGEPRKISFDGNLIRSSTDACSVYFATPFLYATHYPYIVAFEYSLGEGQQPNIVIGQSGDDFLVERVSLYQGYPNINKGEIVGATKLISPDFRSGVAIKEATAHIFQDTEGKGEMSVGNYLVMEYPSDWDDMELVPSVGETEYVETKIIDSKRILPSWWWVKAESEETGTALIRFGQGYDRQWGIYKNGLDMVRGKVTGENNRCDGWANCFEVEVESGDNEFYVFYWPEVLATAGWILSLSTASALIFFRKWKKSAKK